MAQAGDLSARGRHDGTLAECSRSFVDTLRGCNLCECDAWLDEAFVTGQAWPLLAVVESGHRDAGKVCARLLPRIIEATPYCSDVSNGEAGFELPGWLMALDKAGIDVHTTAVGDALVRWLCTVSVHLPVARYGRHDLAFAASLIDSRDRKGRPIADNWGWRWVGCGGYAWKAHTTLTHIAFMEALWERFGWRLDWFQFDMSRRTLLEVMLATAPVGHGSRMQPDAVDMHWRQCGVWTLARGFKDMPWTCAGDGGWTAGDMPCGALAWSDVAVAAIAPDRQRDREDNAGRTRALIEAGLLHAVGAKDAKLDMQSDAAGSAVRCAARGATRRARWRIQERLNTAEPSLAGLLRHGVTAEALDEELQWDEMWRDIGEWRRWDWPPAPAGGGGLTLAEMAARGADGGGGQDGEAGAGHAWTLYDKQGVEAMETASASADEGCGSALRKRLRDRLDPDGRARLPLANGGGLADALPVLAQDFPHLREVCDFVSDFLVLGEAGDGAFWLPPMLLCGEPGIGKTFFLTRLAEAAGTDFHAIDMSGISGGLVLTGSSSKWRGGSPGVLFNKMLASRCANPIILLDEMDKTIEDGTSPVSPALLAVLEPTTAGRFCDEHVGLPLDLRKVTWVASANEAGAISPPLLSRMHVFRVPTPSHDERMVLCKGVWRAIRATEAWGWRLAADLDDVAADCAARACEQARDGRLLLARAASHAIRNGRAGITPADITSAQASLARARGGMGFLRP